jgi:acetyl-CoA carboxylase biotin carboxyl carrier protein
VPTVQHVAAPIAAAPAAAAASDAGDDKPASGADDTSGLVPITCPMVGTVYLAPNPDSPAFVKSGDAVGPDSTVCLIEAMKVFSEIKAETAGTVERVLVTSGQAVQYGQTLMLVRPN